MGTRHQQKVINKQGEVKLSQYGQWDGYPSGQGVDILNFLRKANLEKYQTNINSLRQATEEDYIKVNKFVAEVQDRKIKDYEEELEVYRSNPKWYALDRDCGSKIHKFIENGDVSFVNLIEQKEADEWCAGFYTIDFQTNKFISKFYGGDSVEFDLDNLPTEEEYLSYF